MRKKFLTIADFKQKAQESGDAVKDIGVYKDFVMDEVKAVEGEDLTLEFVISTAGVDRDEDTINPNGWKLDNFNKNPVVLFAHDYTSLPVANAIVTWVEGDKLKSQAKFTPKDLYPFGYMVYQFYKQGFMKATSVGFNPYKWQFSEDRKSGIDFIEQELLEWSCVPVPANPEALIAASAEGIDTEPLKEWAEKVLDEYHQEKGIWLPKSKIEQIFDVLNTKRMFVMPGEPEFKGVISYNQAHQGGTPKAAEDEPWDGPAEVAAADVEDLKVMCAWVDSDNPDIKGSYKLPHHKAAGEHAVVWRGVSAAMGALLGARGGADIPESDRRGVYNHLAQHYREFDKEPPEFESGGSKEGNLEQIKVGAVLNKKNKERLVQAQQLIQEVLDTAEPAEEEDSIHVGQIGVNMQQEDDIQFETEELKSLINDALKEALKAITGKID